MQYFIGVIPPFEYRKKIVEFQRRWSNNGLPTVAEPHVTVKAQAGLNEDMCWLEKVKEACSAFPSFQLSIVEPKWFGDSVLYLDIESEQIYELHRRLVQAVSPSAELINRYFELDLYTPHLTLGQTHFGMTQSELEEMMNQVDAVLRPYPTYEVKHVRIYREIQPDKYQPFQNIELS